jgi:hypothetical protein
MGIGTRAQLAELRHLLCLLRGDETTQECPHAVPLSSHHGAVSRPLWYGPITCVLYPTGMLEGGKAVRA